MGIKIETPKQFSGTEKEQILQVYSYLFRLSENLNIALNNLTADNFESATRLKLIANTGGGTSLDENSQANLAHNYRELKSLIVNTAEIIRSEMDKIETELNSSYEAISSEWGTYQENITNVIEATAMGILQSYNYDAKLETMRQEMAGFSEYQITTEGFIRQGFIDYDENNIPIIGIAVGQGLTTTKVVLEDGTVYEKIDKNQNCAFYTANKLSFRVNGQEVAYLSNRKLYIYDVEINGTIVLKGVWAVDVDDENLDFEIDWIGGDE